MTAPTAPAATPVTRLPRRAAAVLVVAAVVVLGGGGMLIAQLAQSPKPAGASIAPPGGNVLPPLHGNVTSTSTTSTTLGGGGGGGGSSSVVSLGNGVVTMTMPTGWHVDKTTGGTEVFLWNSGASMDVAVDQISNAQASGVVADMVLKWLSQDHGYSQVQPKALAINVPIGATGAAADSYTALYTSNSGSLVEYGNLFVFTRADGWVVKLEFAGDGATQKTADQAFITGQPDFNAILAAARSSFTGAS